jgi:hypothetical protein
MGALTSDNAVSHRSRRPAKPRGEPARPVGRLLPGFAGWRALSSLDEIGGIGVLGFWPAVVLVEVWSLVAMSLAPRLALPAEMMLRMERMS